MKTILLYLKDLPFLLFGSIPLIGGIIVLVYAVIVDMCSESEYEKTKQKIITMDL
jgi:hypothetical protein